jgi:hypothetical protein
VPEEVELDSSGAFEFFAHEMDVFIVGVTNFVSVVSADAETLATDGETRAGSIGCAT